MHCIEIAANQFKQFKALVERSGGQVSVVSRYTDRSVRLLDVEVSKDTVQIERLERVFGYKNA